MRLLDYYKRMMLYRNIAFYSLVIIIFGVGGYFVSAGVLKIGYLMLMYLGIIIAYFNVENRLFRKPVKDKEQELINEVQKELFKDKIEEYVEYLAFQREKSKGNRKLYISSLQYFYHNLLTEEPYEHFNEIVELNKIQIENQTSYLNFIYEFEALRLSREKKYDKVVEIQEKLSEYIQDVYDAGNADVEYAVIERQKESLELMKKAYTEKDREAFEKTIYLRMNAPAHFKVIGAYLDVLLCQDFGWEDLIPSIQNIIQDIDGDIDMLNYVRTA